MHITFLPVTVDAIQWTGTNDHEVTGHLHTPDWRTVAGSPTLPGWWLYRDPSDDAVCAMSDEMRRARTI